MKLILLVPALVLGGCGLLDAFFGVAPDGSAVEGDGPAGTVAPLLDLVLPGAGALLGIVGTVWASIRGRRWRQVAEGTIKGLARARDIGIIDDALKAKLYPVLSCAGELTAGDAYEKTVKAVKEQHRRKEPPNASAGS